MICKLSVHKSCNCQQFPKQAGTGLLPLLTNISSDGQEILKQMLVYDPDARCNVKRLLEHRYFINYREHSDKVLQRRVSFTEESRKSSHVGGDWRGSSHKATQGLTTRRNDKYVTNVNRASQNNVIDIKRYVMGGGLGKRSQATVDTGASMIRLATGSCTDQSQLKSTSLQGYTRYMDGSASSKEKQSSVNLHKGSMFRKTTSNIPQLINKNAMHGSFVSKGGGAPFPKSTLALPRLREPPPPLGASTSAAAASKHHDLKLPKPPKIMILDSTLKNISKMSQSSRSKK